MQPKSEISSKRKQKTKSISSSSSQQQHQNQQQQQQQQRQRQQQQRQQQQLSTGTATKVEYATSRTTSTTTTAAAATANTSTSKLQQQQHNNSPKVIKGKKPLQNFKFYLDIRDHQQTKKIEEQITALGGSLEFFLTPSVTHFITDKTVQPPNNNNTFSSRPGTPQTPATPSTPQTPFSIESLDGKNNGNSTTPSTQNTRRTRQSRADAILNRARRQSSTLATVSTNVTATVATIGELTTISATTVTSVTKSESGTYAAQSSQHQFRTPYTLWKIEDALRYFKKVRRELKDHLELPAAQQHHRHHQRKLAGKNFAVEPTYLKGSFIKIEALKRNFRPYYHLFKKPTEWPKIELIRDEGAFRLSRKKTPLEVEEELQRYKLQKMTRKSRSRSSQRPHPMPAAVQTLKKCETVAKTSTGQRNSNLGGGCKNQIKETSDKQQCGVCEICKIEYDTLTIHLKTKDHEFFAKNPQNFIALDTLINTSASVNSFLGNETNKQNELKPELHEMEVEEENPVDINAPDPLEHAEPRSASGTRGEKRHTSGGAHKTPSPTLREKSKRSTKGKHSSEKFQNVTKQTYKSPKTPPKSSSPQKKPSSSMLELQRIDTAATVATTATTAISIPPKTRKKTAVPAQISPPIRAMLPPSSLYKVVETPDSRTPARKNRDAGDQAVGSPSLIVKFKKVRQTELLRLNGEAENFMFPKRRTSSELPTDVDRQTTSENTRVSVSSTSLDSTSELIEAELEQAATAIVPVGKKAIITAKRKKAPLDSKQSFPITPIQPEVLLKRLRTPLTGTATATATATATTTATAIATATSTVMTPTTTIVSNASITLPEATRKSSRTATAIVTAATKSSRLLRAAVEAAKSNNRRVTIATSTTTNCESTTTSAKAAGTGTGAGTIVKVPLSSSSITNRGKSLFSTQGASMSTTTTTTATSTTTTTTTSTTPAKATAAAATTTSSTIMTTTSTTTTTVKATRKCKASVVRMEDGMGDDDLNTDESDNDIDEENDHDEQDNDEEDEESDDEQDDDDDDDEDYMSGKKHCVKTRLVRPTTMSIREKRSSTRAQRAARRENRRSEIFHEHDSDDDDLPAMTKTCTPSKKQNSIATKRRPVPPQQTTSTATTTTTPHKKISPQRVFDHTTSERLLQLRYAFERLPTSDLWYRVFRRQDLCEENYFEYFGSTQYRKLPYELGPIPFDRTVHGICCKLCQQSKSGTLKQEPVGVQIKNESTATLPATKIDDKSAISLETAQPTTSAQYAHKHKKLHLLQRYRQEQQELQKQQKQHQEQQPPLTDLATGTLDLENGEAKCAAIADVLHSKASTPDRERNRERAGSTHSTASSYASSNATLSKKPYRNKHLQKAAFLNLELPPRKSPREHASTLALVSCLIKQRQDSQSKPNSETDEPPTTPVATPTPPTLNLNKDDVKPVAMSAVTEVRSPRSMRSAAVTPVEELRFTTEISENVKRMRRGQNKYDHSPPIVVSATRPARGRPGVGRRVSSSLPQHRSSILVTGTKRRKMKQQRNMLHPTHVKHHTYSGLITKNGALPCIRKTGSKKGVLEFEVDMTALKALEAATKHKNMRQLEWEIDKYLQSAGREYDCGVSDAASVVSVGTQVETASNTENASASASQSQPAETANDTLTLSKTAKVCKVKVEPGKQSVWNAETETPPPTDCFSSDFDLYDLFTSAPAGTASEDERAGVSDAPKQKNSFNLYNSAALQNYFKRRKNLKSNRTGWPKVQKKKISVRQQHILQQKICFLQEIGEMENCSMKGELKEEREEEVEGAAEGDGNGEGDCDGDGDDTKGEAKENGVITPPDSEAENDAEQVANEEEEEDAEGTELDVAEESTLAGEEEEDDDDEEEEEEVETMADSNDGEEPEPEAADGDDIDGEADVDADAEADMAEGDDEADEEEDDEEEDCEEEEEDRSNYEPKVKRLRRCTVVSPSEKLTNNYLTPNHGGGGGVGGGVGCSGVTSTPSVHMLRGLRRTTPQLNGSLGSCISPSEKAGDNSDIFTVSSDGLDTDLDMSNSHSQHKADDGDHQHSHQHSQDHHNHCTSHNTPKRKFDLSKYAPSNAATCAAEAATAAVKSLAISQFLKKEVRVTCRRLRAPFRRFRYRR